MPGFSCDTGSLIFAATCSIFSCGMWDLVPPPGIEPRPSALGEQTLSYWTTREVPTVADLLLPSHLLSLPK